MTRIIAPGSTLGVLGSGQLGRMFAIAARRMGYRVAVYSPEDDTPAGQVADLEISGPYDDLDRIRVFAKSVEAITFEFENVPVEAAMAAAQFVPVRPDGAVLHVTQNRVREKRFLSQAGIPVAPFREIAGAADLSEALAAIGTPAILKTAGFGYDGKGQVRIERADDAAAAFAAVIGPTGVRGAAGAAPVAVLEKLVDFRHELSVVGARGVDGHVACYPPFRNEHRRHILDVTVAPAELETTVMQQAVDITRAVLETLHVVGVLCVEFFLTADGVLLVNELAPRPHNSGHVTFDNAVTSQFEQQVRAVSGLPLGDPRLLCAAAMANLLGDCWDEGEPDWAAALATSPAVKLHLYGKAQPRQGRKMGHLTALAREGADAERLVRAARDALCAPARDRRARVARVRA